MAATTGGSPTQGGDQPSPGKVLLIAHYFPPGTSSGTLRTVKFAQYLPDFGWTPHVLTMTPEAYNAARQDYSLLKGLDPNLKVYRTPVWMPDRAAARLLKRVKSMLQGSPAAQGTTPVLQGNPRRGKRRPIRDGILDWLHFPDDYGGWVIPGARVGRRVVREQGIEVLYSSVPSTAAHLIGAALKRLTGLPWVADFRDPWEALFPEYIYLEEENRWKRAVEVALAERIIPMADLLISNTEPACEDLRRRFPKIPAERFVTLPNGYDEQDFAGIASRQEEGEKLTITYAGTFFAGLRTPDEFLEAVKELVEEGTIDPTRICLKFVGCSPAVDPATPWVEVLPRVGYGESLRTMADSDVLLLLQQSPKYRIQIPAKTYEYMALNKWILALTSEGATANLVRRMPNGLVLNPGAKPALKAALLQLYEMFLRRKLYPVPRDAELAKSFTRREQTRVLAGWLRELKLKTCN